MSSILKVDTIQNTGGATGLTIDSSGRVNAPALPRIDVSHSSNNNISYNSKNKLLLSTSGTTGSPKMVRLSEDNLFANSQSICSYLKINNSKHIIYYLNTFLFT